MKLTPSRSLPCLAVLAALVAAGCEPAIDKQEASQPTGVGGLVEVDTSFCVGDGAPATASDSTSCVAGFTGSNQLLIAYEVPTGTAAAGLSLVPPHDSTGAAPAAVALTRDAGLEAWLAATQPPAEGRQWLGFRSPRTAPVGDPNTSVPIRASVAADFDALAGVAPDFAYRTVAYLRYTNDDAAAAAPFTTCDTDCDPIDAFAGVPVAGAAAIRDADLVAPADAVTAQRGTTATVPFTLAYRGAADSGPLAPTVSTTLAGARVAPLPVVTLPTTGDAPLAVQVDVPADAPVGPAKVTVELALADGGVREATGTLVVAAPPVKPAAPAPAAPAPKPALTPAQLQSALAQGADVGRASVKKGLTLTQAFPSAGDAAFELRLVTGKGRERSLSKPVRKAVPPSGKVAVRLPLATQGRKLLAGRESVKAVLVVRFHDGAGNRVKVRIPVALG